MRNNRFMFKCIIALLSCIIGLSSYGAKKKIPTKEIHYTTTDNSVLPIKDSFLFGEGRIVSNTYVPKKNVCILKFDKKVTVIEKGTFANCESLTSISFPKSVTKIGDETFNGCKSLTSVRIPEDVTRIGEGAFEDCTNLREVEIPEDCYVHKGAFSGCRKVRITRYWPESND